jgi:hypothetical protein
MKQLAKTGIKLCTVAIVATTLIAGCATAPLRTEASTSGISSAEAAGAANVPQASLYLQLAKEELQQAKALAAKGEEEEAASMLKRSESDAELAVVLSREDAEKAEAMAAVERARQLRQENK